MKIPTPLVSITWLNTHLNAQNLIILDATIPKVGGKNEDLKVEKRTIPNAVFFDLKKVFSNPNSTYPNTALNAVEFQKEAQKLGINNQSSIVVYDDLGIYASPRVWWLFKLMGFTNIAVLNGGLPAWKQAGFVTVIHQKKKLKKGNFVAKYQSDKIKFAHQVLAATTNNTILIVDARSKERFNATVPEPRKEVKGGHIPNSKNLPYSLLQEQGKMREKEALMAIFNKVNPHKKEFIFSCGSGITACILALAAELTENNNYAVYDGSWTEWGSTPALPIEK